MRPIHYAMLGALVFIAVLAVRMVAAILNEGRHDDIDDLIDWENQWNR